ncbi:hybrid sensor histidine kinase/response regulator transcription factor [uncultured Bacteroides sp.]|uniref:hybrid sensor histidine kinase/response regulator transcription factor n=1 Tax=uncultured Bacteroides sp. TaxID=162156 RepID=UPI00260A78AE|nr:hybrid sensor histidine kinase/response regulator transcription factor [uncultured Bacteroides sp.]
MKKHLLLLCLSLFLPLLEALATVEIRSSHMTTSDGLPNNSVCYIFQDSKGFIWFGTLNGLSRYDGNSFVTFQPENGPEHTRVSLASNHARAITEDRNGFLWIETSGEYFNCYDPRQERFVDFTGCNAHRQHYDRKLETADGDIWLWNNHNGCRHIRYANGKFTSVAYKKDLGNLPSNHVSYVYQDQQGNIWIGTNQGVAQINTRQSTAATPTITVDPNDAFAAQSFGQATFFLSRRGLISKKEPAAPTATPITRLPDNATPTTVYGTLRLDDDWVIFTSAGGFIFNMNTHRTTRQPQLDIPNGNVITDNLGNYWVYNHTGNVRYINARTRAVKTFRLSPPDKLNYVDMERYHVVHDSRGIIWISTYGNGLFAYDTLTQELQHFEFQIDSFSHISSNYLQYIIEDSSGTIWTSSEYAGVTRLTILNQGIQRIYPEASSLSDRSNTVRMLTRLTNNDICIGTRGGGLYTYDPQVSTQKNKRQLSTNIYAIAEDHDGTLWMGSRGNGLSIGGQRYVRENTNPASIANNNIFTLLCDRKGRMWVGTFGGGLDLARKEEHGYTFRHFFDKGFGQQRTRTLLEDRNGWIWVGNNDGVYLFQPDSLIADSTNYLIYNYNNRKLRSNEIKSIYQDTQGRIWIGTSGGGLSMCNPEGDYNQLSFKHYNTNNGLVNNMVQAIIEDDQHRLWISTEYGISRFDPERQTFDNFFFSPYTLGDVYSDNSACISQDGRLLFGTNYGLLVINPQQIRKHNAAPPVVTFTNLQVNGTSMRPRDTDSPLKNAMMYTNEIRLKYFQNSFTIDFTTFDYSESNSYTYTYRLENYDKEWSKPSPLSFASYKNLPPGTYSLHVKVCNATGVSADREAVLKIIVTPPFWKTTWAFLIYAALLIAILYIAYRLVLNFHFLRNKVEMEKQLTEYKLVFFTNISHEFRTPLTLIQGALEKIQSIEKIPQEMENSLKVMNKSTQRMLRLINQLLEFRKVQNNKLALSLEETDVMGFLHEIFLSFQDTAASKNMDFRFQPSAAFHKMFIDKGNLDKVVYNLLSNAFKYTPSNGKVTLSAIVDKEKKSLVISVSDTGIGIAQEKRGELFKRFMQSNFSSNSTGIGLHLTRELVNVHKGTITYDENPGGGSVFTVSLPTTTDAYEEKDFLIPHNAFPKEKPYEHEHEEEHEHEYEYAEEHKHKYEYAEEHEHKHEHGHEHEYEEKHEHDKEHKEKHEVDYKVEYEHEEKHEEEHKEETALPEISQTEAKATTSNPYKLLIIEDDNDVREFLKEEFKPYFDVETEADGLSGLERARTYDADLIICDVLMPGLTGFEVTRKLKNDFDTSHIPIILLTAMSSAENHLKGVESGADAYITKPFSPKLLLARAFQLINQREKLRKKFSDEPNMVAPTICTSEKDKQFAAKLQEILEQQIGNSQFAVDDLAAIMGLGRSTFYRKVRGVTGYSPNEYMRIIRMKKAAELLLENRYTVAEVSYKVGIEDPFYFSKCFKKQFGHSPSVYLRGKNDAGEKEGDKESGKEKSGNKKGNKEEA